MKWYYKLGILLTSLILAYLIGNWIPIRTLSPKVDFSTPIKTSEYYTLVVSIIAAVVTFLAVIIALFKEDIRKLWEYSRINVSIPQDSFIEVLNNNATDSTNDNVQILEAIKYDCKIEIHNSGTISALGLEIHLESLIFNGKDYAASKAVEVMGSQLEWTGSKEARINLPSQAKKTLSILNLKGPEQQSIPNGANINIPACLNIAGSNNNQDNKNGKWIGSFAIFSTNSKPKRFKVTIEWSGQWHKRATEMKSCLKISLTD